MSQHVMIDLETWGTGHDAVILSVGAAKYDPNNPTREDIEPFYVAVDPASCQRLGLKIEAGTVEWWMEPARDAARAKLLTDEKVDLASALDGFISWYGTKSLPTWSCGATFDIPIMRNAFNAVGMPCPWKFYDERCYRTLKSLAPAILPVLNGLDHDALDDTIKQVMHTKSIVTYLGLTL